MYNNFILHLTLIDGIGPAIIRRIIEFQRSGVSTSDLYLFSATNWQHKCGFTENASQKLVAGLSDTKMLDEELALIEHYNIQWMTIIDEKYPKLLQEIYLPPMVLYWQGSCEFLSEKEVKAIAVVGARKANNYGEYVINQIIPDLVSAQYTIVSGGAVGIDTMAHRAALKSGGTTLAVLGSGLLRPYPTINTSLFKSIVEKGGGIISSYPLRMEPFAGNFPARNRIVTGLSRGCLVVQAAQKSGALISAQYAMEQGREVFAVPGPIDHELSIGCNALIQKGAKLVMTSVDILEEFGDRIIIPVMQQRIQQLSLESALVSSIKKTEKSVKNEADEEHYSETQKKIIIACKVPAYFDTIVEVTQLTNEIVQSELFQLQLDGVIMQDFAGMWKLLSVN